MVAYMSPEAEPLVTKLKTTHTHPRSGTNESTDLKSSSSGLLPSALSHCHLHLSSGELPAPTSPNFRINADHYHDDHQYGSAPCDGPSVWYCSQCGDGPTADWNPTCANCGHAYCGFCTVESA